MALDPAIIAALSAGAKSSTATSDWDAWRKKVSGEQPGGAWNLGQSIIDVLSTGGYATAGLTNKIGQNFAAIGRGEVGAALDLINPASGVSAMVKGVSDRRTYSDNLKEMGVDPNAAVWLGLALDIGLDPTTYITGGTLAAAKGAAQGAKIASQASKAGKLATKATGADAFTPVNRALTDQEKLGNLLAGIQRGYTTGRDQYKLSIKGNKLRKIQAKKAKTLEEAPRGLVEVGGSFTKLPVGADVASAVEKITAKEQKAAQAVAKAKAKVEASALPGVTAGKAKATAAKVASDASRVVATVEKVDKAFKVVVRSPEGEVVNHSFAKKNYKSEAAATKAAEKAAKEVEAKLQGGAEFDVKQDVTAPSSTDDAVNTALRPVEASAEDARIRSELAEGSRKNAELNKLAQMVRIPGTYLPGRFLGAEDQAAFDSIRDEFLAKFEDFKETELAASAKSGDKIAKITVDDLNKYASAVKPKPNAVFDEMLAAPAFIPNTFRELVAVLRAGRIAPGDATIGDLVFFAGEEGLSPAALEQLQKAFVLSKQTFEETAATADVTLKPWIDGIVTPNDAEDAIREMMEYIYKDLPKTSKAYKAIVKTVSDAFAGKLKAVSGGMDKPLTSDEVEEVFEAFFAGANIPNALNKVGAIDLAKIQDNTYNNINELTKDLQAGNIVLSEAFKRDLANILGVPPSIITATLAKVYGSVDGLGRVLDDAADAPLAKGEITPNEAATATGNMTGAGAADVASPSLATDAIEDIANQAADVTVPIPTAAIPEAARASLIAQRERAAADFQADMREIQAVLDQGDRESVRRIVNIVRENIMPQVAKQIERLAKKREMSVDDVLEEVLRGDLRVISEDPASITFGGALKLDELGSHGKLDIYTYLLKGSIPLYKNQASAALMLQREALTISAVENLYRSLGIPVRSSESAAMAFKRENVKPNSKKAKSVKRQYSSVGWSDIAREMLKQNKTDLGFRLRGVRGEKNAGYELGNFLPNSIEAAWLTVKRFKETGAEFPKGSANYDEIIYALENVEQLGGGFKKAPQALYAEKVPAAAADIERTSDELIKFLDDNYESFKVLDNSREGSIIAENGQAVFQQANRVFANMIRFSAEFANLKQAFKDGRLTEAQLTNGFGDLIARYDELVERLTTGGFSDKSLAQNMAGVYKSILINARITAADGTVVTFPGLVQELTNTLAMTRAADAAMDSARAAGKSADNVERAGKAARTTQKSKNVQQDMEIALEQIARAQAAGEATPAAEEALDAAVQATVSLNSAFAKTQTKWTKLGKALSGNYGMGDTFKTILSSSEQSAVSYSHLFSLGLRDIARATRGREAEVETAFKALQAYRKELDAAQELDEVINLDDFLANYGAVDREIFDALDGAFDVLLGSKNVFGAAKSLGIMKTELNTALRQFGLGSLRLGDGQTFDNFWLAYEPKENGKPINAFEFLNLLNLAVHRAASRVEIASQFDNFVAKTPKQITDAGESLKDYVEIKTDTSIGELLGETNKLVHKDDAERLKYVQDYLNYDSVFSEGALSRVIDVTDRVTYVLKSTNTLLRPGHHVTSIVGEAAMNLLAGVRISSYNNTARILNKFRPGQYENAGEPFKAYAELNAVKGKRIKASEFDTVSWIRPDGKREVLPDEIVYQLAERWGVLVHPGGSLEDFMATGDAMLKGAYAKFHNGMNKISVFASHRDNFFRLTHFIDELQRTTGAKTVEEAALAAATAIRQWHPTAGSLSAFEKKYARRVVYFYTWQRVALTKVVATMIERPGIVTIPSKVQYAIADANGFNPESFGDPWDPDGIYASWHTGQMWGPQFQGPAGEGDAWGVQPAIQPIDIVGQLAKPFTLQPGRDPITSMAQGASDLFGQNLNPIVRTLVESSTQSRLGEGGDLPGAPEYLLNQIGVVNTISKLTGIGQDPNPYETPQETEEKNARLVFNLLFGQRVTDYSTPASQYKWTLDQQEIARRLAGQ